MSAVQKRKLIEVALPLEAINRESAREKSIRHGHPSTLHLWWARRPLAAARAVLFAQLVDDPSSHPDKFPTEELQRKERERLHGIIERLVVWENLRDEKLLAEAHAEILSSTDGNPPPILDPFAGGGTIPLEAKRLGLQAWGNDINPLPVLINTVILELVDRFPISEPVSGGMIGNPAECMAADLRYFAKVLESRALDKVRHLYPRTQSSGEPLVYFWARTVQCPNPACDAEVPLVGSWKASARQGSESYFRPVFDETNRVFDVEVCQGTAGEPEGTMKRTGGTCPACGEGFPLSYVKNEGIKGKVRSRLLAVQQRHGRVRTFEPADEAQRAAADPELDMSSIDWLNAQLSTHSQYMAPPRYGMVTFKDLFSSRQLRTLTEFVGELDTVQQDVEQLARRAGLADDNLPYASGGRGAVAYGDAMRIMLALGLSRLVNRQSTLCIWHAGRQTVEQVFARQAYSMTWFYAEANPFAGASGSFTGQIDFLAKAIANLPIGRGCASQGPAQNMNLSTDVVVSTDPPYYDSVPYADLSDFFLVWLRHILADTLPIFPTMLAPKREELVADHVRWSGKVKARDFFEQGMQQAFACVTESHSPDIPMTVYYAYKQNESTDEGQTSSGWATLLTALLQTGWGVVGTWPVRTEQTGGLRELGRGALDSSVVVVCRRRSANAPTTSRQGFMQDLRSELPAAVRLLQRGRIAPVDQGQSTLGPGMAIFSRYSKVIEPDGSAMSVNVAITLINQVLDEVVNDQEGDFDATTRFAIAWYRHAGYGIGKFGEVDRIARWRNTSVEAMQRSGVLKKSGEKVHLINHIDLPENYDVLADQHISVWEALHHLMMILERDGVSHAGEFLRTALTREDGAIDADLVKELAHLLFRVAEGNRWTKDALSFNTLVTSWPEIVGAARSTPTVSTSSQGAFDFDEDD